MLLIAGCGGSPAAPAPQNQTPPASQPPSPPPAPQTPATWDVDTQGIPQLTTHNYIDLALIEQISRFRSGVGHDYWDDYERCRSMKHYFMTPVGSRASSVGIYAPFDGTIVRTIPEWAGVQIHIAAKANPLFTAVLFHVNPSIPVADGTPLTGGQRLGTHIGDMTMSDITVQVDAPKGRRLVSWFHTMTDAVFDAYRARGMTSRDEAVISKAERDASPLTCNGEAFADSGTLQNWIVLR